MPPVVETSENIVIPQLLPKIKKHLEILHHSRGNVKKWRTENDYMEERGFDRISLSGIYHIE